MVRCLGPLFYLGRQEGARVSCTLAHNSSHEGGNPPFPFLPGGALVPSLPTTGRLERDLAPQMSQLNSLVGEQTLQSCCRQALCRLGRLAPFWPLQVATFWPLGPCDLQQALPTLLAPFLATQPGGIGPYASHQHQLVSHGPTQEHRKNPWKSEPANSKS